jgi:hypothetical protein
VVHIGPRRISVDVAGVETCRYQFELGATLLREGADLADLLELGDLSREAAGVVWGQE